MMRTNERGILMQNSSSSHTIQLLIQGKLVGCDWDYRHFGLAMTIFNLSICEITCDVSLA